MHVYSVPDHIRELVDLWSWIFFLSLKAKGLDKNDQTKLSYGDVERVYHLL